MQIIRTLMWILLTIVLVAFIAMNWHRAPVNIWPLETNYLQLDWPVGFIALVFFLLGFVPMWLYHRAGKWRWQRRISALEHSVRATAVAPPLATSTQLEAAQQQSEEPTA
ncbi:MAG TPA: LapA family protein [Novosphingobium sp.]